MPSRAHVPSAESLGARLSRVLSRPEAEDPAVREVFDHMDNMQRRIEAVREEVKRGVRGRGKPFRL